MSERVMQLLQSRESEQLEFKVSHKSLPKNLFETICAFLNHKGGDILLGVDDTAGVVGIDASCIEQFIKDIVQGRKMKPEKVRSLADGRIFTGEESKELGLVDRIGNLEDSIEWAGRKGGIEGEIDVVYAPEKRYPWIKYLIGTLFGRVHFF